MHKTISPEDNPVLQYKGPIRALVILLKYQSVLSTVYPNYFSTMQSLSNGLLNILYNSSSDFEAFRKELIFEISSLNAMDGNLLTDSFTHTNELDDFQRMQSIRYLEYYKQQDIEFLKNLICYVQASCHQANEILAWPFGLEEHERTAEYQITEALSHLDHVIIERRYTQYNELFYTPEYYSRCEKIEEEQKQARAQAARNRARPNHNWGYSGW